MPKAAHKCNALIKWAQDKIHHEFLSQLKMTRSGRERFSPNPSSYLPRDCYTYVRNSHNAWMAPSEAWVKQYKDINQVSGFSPCNPWRAILIDWRKRFSLASKCLGHVNTKIVNEILKIICMPRFSLGENHKFYFKTRTAKDECISPPRRVFDERKIGPQVHIFKKQLAFIILMYH